MNDSRSPESADTEFYRTELEELSFKDGLTGVANRRLFDSIFEVEWEGRAARGCRCRMKIQREDNW